ncbi:MULTISPECIES: ABC transporter permease [unclassified Halanaerobium]|uniref:ABC transporter permease n=1 Tax=unclassified Halanaerobium TaxID=2641197 RepID=UPI000DF386C0|nr:MULTISPECIES: ABC transporter permease [unclassified Halanaerobium]RCW40672.1 NitT/TauT family transport system permease protein [Halanaerobium sp. MA284_MarDTE_T2]RCW78934.1 NitT/TauT family transport system permease protein [Halanaerobium sp. DL-01]
MNKFDYNLKGLVPVLIFFIVWESAASLNLIFENNFLPSIKEIIVEFYYLTINGVLIKNFYSSLLRVLAGVFLGSFLGLVVGILMGWKENVNQFLGLIISLTYPIPALGWLPLFIIFFGVNNLVPVLIIFICCFFPIVYNTIAGIKGVDNNLINAARTLGASEIKILFTIIIPLALPSIFTGLKLESGMAWRVVIAAEMIAIPTGIGALMMKAENLVRVDIIIVCLLLLSLMCFLFEKTIVLLESKFTDQWR